MGSTPTFGISRSHGDMRPACRLRGRAGGCGNGRVRTAATPVKLSLHQHPGGMRVGRPGPEVSVHGLRGADRQADIVLPVRDGDAAIRLPGKDSSLPPEQRVGRRNRQSPGNFPFERRRHSAFFRCEVEPLLAHAHTPQAELRGLEPDSILPARPEAALRGHAAQRGRLCIQEWPAQMAFPPDTVALQRPAPGERRRSTRQLADRPLENPGFPASLRKVCPGLVPENGRRLARRPPGPDLTDVLSIEEHLFDAHPRSKDVEEAAQA